MKHRVVSYDKIIASFTDPDDAFVLEDHGKSVNNLVSYCDREVTLWNELQAVERACKKLKPVFRKTLRTVYRVVRFERCAEEEQRPLILRMLRVKPKAYYERIRVIIQILTHSRLR